MEEYFKAARVPEGEKVRITSMYLTGDANKLWWRRRMEDDAYAGRPTIERWEVLKKELKDQFLPCKTAWVARDSLKKLKHTGTVREYVKELSSLMLDIKNMSEENKLFNFMSGLRWAQIELRRQGVKDLPSAMDAADSLVSYKLGKSSESDASKPKSKDKNKKREERSSNKEKDGGKAKPKADGQESKGKTNSGSFICNGPHRAKNCPSKAREAECLSCRTKEVESDSESPTRVNPLQLLNAIHTESSRLVH